MPADSKDTAVGQIAIAGQNIEYRLRPVREGRLRVRVGLRGVDVLQPSMRPHEDVETFLRDNGDWLLEQVDRVAQLRALRRVADIPAGEILLHGVPTPVRVEDVPRRARSNKVRADGDQLVLVLARHSRTPPAATLENWLRRKARGRIAPLVQTLADKLGVTAGRLYIMDQQTKWGNCSALRNLSFNWRIVMAPDPVLDYLVTHEVVHLVVPDHSRKFWLTVQSLCPESERARQWLSANGHLLLVNLPDVVTAASNGRN